MTDCGDRESADVGLATLGGGSGDELREACEELEYRMGIKAPQRHRKLLGPWAPLATSGARMATATAAISKQRLKQRRGRGHVRRRWGV